MDSSTSFGRWLRQRRKALGLTHATLADGAHCSVSALRKIEQDERRPSRGLAERLAACLDIAPPERERFVAIARGERRADRLDLDVPPLAVPPLPAWDPAMPSIAVLPFANLGDDAANEHFADGLAEELLNILARIPGLRVASRTSAFSFKGQHVDVRTLARRLDVSTVLEGSVRRAGERVRIAAQLVRAATDSHLWSEVYDRSLQDIFAVQDDIAQSVVTALRAVLLGEGANADASAQVRTEILAATHGRTRDARAHELYLQGRFLIERVTAEDTATGIEYCRQALQADPRYALAWAGLAGAYSTQASFGWAPLADTVERARAAAERALALQPDLAEAHAELGWIRMTFDWDWRGADASYRRALAFGAGHPGIVRAASLLADSLERIDEAVALARRAVALDPLSFIARGNLALRCLDAGRLEEAQDAVRQALELNPRGTLLHWVLGVVRLEQDRPGDARDAFEREPLDVLRLLGLALVAHAEGRHAERQAMLEALVEQGRHDAAFQVAEAFAACGDADRAFDWLERAHAQRDPGLAHLRTLPLLRPLRGDPRWPLFLAKMGFAE
ncbi:MAG TPA: helix-turn-helix domain-containing protein [Albitalea sp.]